MAIPTTGSVKSQSERSRREAKPSAPVSLAEKSQSKPSHRLQQAEIGLIQIQLKLLNSWAGKASFPHARGRVPHCARSCRESTWDAAIAPPRLDPTQGGSSAPVRQGRTITGRKNQL